MSAALRDLHGPSPMEAVAILRARAAEFAYGTRTDDICLLAARIDLATETPAVRHPSPDRPSDG